MTAKPRFQHLLVCASLLLVAACSRPAEPQAEALPEGLWRVEFRMPGGLLPAGLELRRSGQDWSAEFINGDERVEVPEVVVDGPDLRLVFPAFNNRLQARWDGTSLEGVLNLVKRGGVVQEIPFRAKPGTEYRFAPEQAAAQVDISGRWSVTFMDDDGAESPAVGEFEQEGNRARGTFLTETGDYRFLEGNVVGRQLLLSTFDGSHLFLFAAELDEDDQLRGDFWSGTAWHERWSAKRDPQAALADPYALTYLKPGYERLAFTFPDPQGRPVSLADERFRGKVVLVTLAGTWCPNCHDEARFLAPFYREYRDQGLEVIALLYEHFEDFETAAAQARAFRDELGIEYPLLVAGYSDKQRAAETLPMLSRVLAFPTTIFVARDGGVRRIHTGFSGPGTGEHYREFTSQFEAYVQSLLNEGG